MGWELVVIAASLLGFSVVSRRLAGTSITSAIVFVGVGLLAGIQALDLFDAPSTGESVKVLAEATLAFVLFSDASRIDLRALRREYTVPARLLGIGLPLTIVLGAIVASFIFQQLSLTEAVVIAVLLAPTDAALGQAVVTEPRLPSRIRQGLNVESGLNDGICVPLLFIALAVAEADAGSIGDAHAARIVVEQIGYGLCGGVIGGLVTAAAVVVGTRRGLIEPAWLQVVPAAGAVLSYGFATALGGSGFIAAFTAGMIFSALRRPDSGEVTYLIDELGARTERSDAARVRRRVAPAGARRSELADRGLRDRKPDGGSNAPGRHRDDGYRRGSADRRVHGLVRSPRAGLDRLRPDRSP